MGYEEVMAIYDFFVTFVRECSMSHLLSSQNFDIFKAIAVDFLSRILFLNRPDDL
jgi:hypothetical protein